MTQYIINKDLFEVKEGPYGKILELKGEWQPWMADFMKKNNIFGLNLNYTKGWKNTGLEFLQEVKNFLEHFSLLDHTTDDISSLNIFMPRLKNLSINTYCNSEINFINFPSLERCGLYYRKKAISIFNCLTLKQLSISHYSENNIDKFSQLINLEQLTLIRIPTKDINGLRNLHHLNNLGLHYLTKLDSISGIENLSELNHLHIQSCKKIKTLKELSHLENLETLILEDLPEIESIQPLRNLKKLTKVYLSGRTTVLDGDLSVLKELPLLKNVLFGKRKHYSHALEDFKVK